MFKKVVSILLVGSSLLYCSADSRHSFSQDQAYLTGAAFNCLPSDIDPVKKVLLDGFFNYLSVSRLKKLDKKLIATFSNCGINQECAIGEIKNKLNQLAKHYEGQYFSPLQNAILRRMTNMDRTLTTLPDTAGHIKKIFFYVPKSCLPDTFDPAIISVNLAGITNPSDAYSALWDFVYEIQCRVLIPYLRKDPAVSLTFIVANCFNLLEDGIIERALSRENMMELILSTTPFQRYSFIKNMEDFDLLRQYTQKMFYYVNTRNAVGFSSPLHKMRDDLFVLSGSFPIDKQYDAILYLMSIRNVIGLYSFFEVYCAEPSNISNTLNTLTRLGIGAHLVKYIQSKNFAIEKTPFDRGKLEAILKAVVDKTSKVSLYSEFIRLMEFTKRPVAESLKKQIDSIPVYGLYRLMLDHQGPLAILPSNLDELSAAMPLKKEKLEYPTAAVAADHQTLPASQEKNLSKLKIDELLEIMTTHLSVPNKTPPQASSGHARGVNVHSRDGITEKNCKYFMAFMKIVMEVSDTQLNESFCMKQIERLKENIQMIPESEKITKTMKNNAIACLSKTSGAQSWPTLVEKDDFMNKYGCSGLEFISNVITFIIMHSKGQKKTLVSALIPALSSSLTVCGDGKVQRIMIATVQGWLKGVNIDCTDQDPFSILCERDPNAAAQQMSTLFFSNPKYQGEEGVGGNTYTRSEQAMRRFLREFLNENPNIPTNVQDLVRKKLEAYLKNDGRDLMSST